MNRVGRKRLLILITAFTALALTSTAMGQVIISNTYSMESRTITPDVNITQGDQTYSGLAVSTNQPGSVAYANISVVLIYAPHNTYKNLSDILNISSHSHENFYYTANITKFSGSAHVANLDLYSVNSTGTFVQNFAYSTKNGNQTGKTPVSVTPQTTTGLGLNMGFTKKQAGSSYTWELDLQINGYYTSAHSSKVIFVQYYIHFLISTTIEP